MDKPKKKKKEDDQMVDSDSDLEPIRREDIFPSASASTSPFTSASRPTNPSTNRSPILPTTTRHSTAPPGSNSLIPIPSPHPHPYPYGWRSIHEPHPIPTIRYDPLLRRFPRDLKNTPGQALRNLGHRAFAQHPYTDDPNVLRAYDREKRFWERRWERKNRKARESYHRCKDDKKKDGKGGKGPKGGPSGGMDDGGGGGGASGGVAA